MEHVHLDAYNSRYTHVTAGLSAIKIKKKVLGNSYKQYKLDLGVLSIISPDLDYDESNETTPKSNRPIENPVFRKGPKYHSTRPLPRLGLAIGSSGTAKRTITILNII